MYMTGRVWSYWTEATRFKEKTIYSHSKIIRNVFYKLANKSAVAKTSLSDNIVYYIYTVNTNIQLQNW